MEYESTRMPELKSPFRWGIKGNKILSLATVYLF